MRTFGVGGLGGAGGDAVGWRVGANARPITLCSASRPTTPQLPLACTVVPPDHRHNRWPDRPSCAQTSPATRQPSNAALTLVTVAANLGELELMARGDGDDAPGWLLTDRH